MYVIPGTLLGGRLKRPSNSRICFHISEWEKLWSPNGFNFLSLGAAFAIPDLNTNPLLYPIQKSCKENGSLASYIAAVMTRYGHK